MCVATWSEGNYDPAARKSDLVLFFLEEVVDLLIPEKRVSVVISGVVENRSMRGHDLHLVYGSSVVPEDVSLSWLEEGITESPKSYSRYTELFRLIPGRELDVSPSDGTVIIRPTTGSIIKGKVEPLNLKCYPDVDLQRSLSGAGLRSPFTDFCFSIGTLATRAFRISFELEADSFDDLFVERGEALRAEIHGPYEVLKRLPSRIRSFQETVNERGLDSNPQVSPVLGKLNSIYESMTKDTSRLVPDGYRVVVVEDPDVPVIVEHGERRDKFALAQWRSRSYVHFFDYSTTTFNIDLVAIRPTPVDRGGAVPQVDPNRFLERVERTNLEIAEFISLQKVVTALLFVCLLFVSVSAFVYSLWPSLSLSACSVAVASLCLVDLQLYFARKRALLGPTGVVIISALCFFSFVLGLVGAIL